MNDLASHDRAELERLEASLWRAETRFDPAWMEQVLAEDFLEIGRSGRVYTRAEILGLPRAPLPVRLPLPDLTIRRLAPEVAQVLYTSVVETDAGPAYGRRSSLWIRRGRRWVLCFHQGTPFQP
ncbi:MAG: nuclear transport factor 2 family protein [Anaerolineales bacterium]|nr:nuclear transport factor 2 family protein [Anaerolineales bacterium]